VPIAREKGKFVLLQLHVPRTVQEKVLSFGTPRMAGYKKGRFKGISNTNLPFLVNLSFLLQKQIYKLASRKLTEIPVEAIQICLPHLL